MGTASRAEVLVDLVVLTLAAIGANAVLVWLGTLPRRLRTRRDAVRPYDALARRDRRRP